MGRTLLSAKCWQRWQVTQDRRIPLSHSSKNQNQSGGQECPPHIYFASVTCSRDSLYVPNLFATGFSVG